MNNPYMQAPPELVARYLEATQKQQQAQNYMNMPDAQAQMVGGRYIPPNLGQALAKGLGMYQGDKMMGELPQDLAQIQGMQNQFMQQQEAERRAQEAERKQAAVSNINSTLGWVQPTPDQLGNALHSGAFIHALDSSPEESQRRLAREVAAAGGDIDKGYKSFWDTHDKAHSKLREQGFQPEFSGGRWGVRSIPGYNEGMFEREGGKTAATEAARAPYSFQQVPMADGSTRMIPTDQLAQALRNPDADRHGIGISRPKEQEVYETKRAEAGSARYDDIRAQASNSQNVIYNLDALEGIINETGLETGALQPMATQLRSVANSLGFKIDSEKLSGAELMTKIGNEMALLMRNPESGLGMPGAVSDRDLTFLKEAQVGIDRSPEGNRKMIMVMRKLAERKIEIARLADDYVARNGRMDDGFEKVVREYSNTNPMFSPGDFGSKGATGQPAGGRPDLSSIWGD